MFLMPTHRERSIEHDFGGEQGKGYALKRLRVWQHDFSSCPNWCYLSPESESALRIESGSRLQNRAFFDQNLAALGTAKYHAPTPRGV